MDWENQAKAEKRERQEKGTRKNPQGTIPLRAFLRAADRNRTGDLHITNVTLYRLSHSSIWTCFRNHRGLY